MSGQYTTEEVADYVEQEGLGYAIMYGLDAENITDASLRRKWKRASKLLAELTEALGVEV